MATYRARKTSMASKDNFRTYLFSYEHNGARWGFEVMAPDPDDAKCRLAKIANAKFDGELMASIPVSAGIVGFVRRLIAGRFN